MSSSKKLILVIGATGAQGRAVIDGLLAPSADGLPSPYAVRALTRDPSSRRAKELIEKGVECVKGAFDDFSAVKIAFEGVYGAYVNTDGFTVGEERELYAGVRIFEIAKIAKTVRHYVWSNANYSLKIGNYNPIYCCEHVNGKARVGEWLRSQPTEVSDSTLSWSMITLLPYMDMLSSAMFGPLNRRADGTFVFATPLGRGHMPMIALNDIGYYARYTFDCRAETSGQELSVGSDIVGWDYLVDTFKKVTGEKAVVLQQPLEEWFKNFNGVDLPVASERRVAGDESTTWRQNFTGWWAMWQNDLVSRDMEWIKKIHPNVLTLERWMREKKYDGKLHRDLLKNSEDSKGISINFEVTSQL